MTRGRITRLLAGAAMVAVGLAGAASPAGAQDAPSIVALELTGVVDDFVADYLSSNIARAQDEGADAVLLTIDTPGGLSSSMQQISGAIVNATVPVIGYVAPSGR